ncbi:hypothetical protein HYDPIDRAFT_34694 [Hydnomerulius pinastri MD-312]|uniref:Uncharacterized protein n=1 Tax=Hydnomerulius pinastri MD-312 TaxID=994086 RepID=A0A0C9UXX8_9AGAM|nr:hypothetical protein HYDPIDRAFT_34694 [Hydnomerulius pinastri MD-312]
MIADDIQKGKKTGWKVMKQNDGYLMRAYMSFKYMPSINLNLTPAHLSTNMINWCEMLDKSSGWYDRGEPFSEVEWKCFDGGSQVLIDYMANTSMVRITAKISSITIRESPSSGLVATS